MRQETSHLDFFSKIKKELKITDPENRKKKAQKILSVLKDFAEQNQLSLERWDCLDIGCSTCLITTYFPEHFNRVVGMDMDVPALKIACDHMGKDRSVKLVVSNAQQAPFPDNSFDLVICNQIYEHVPDAEKLFDEIYRLLKPGGVCYFSAGNKFMILEPHYDLPFLSWLPPSLANFYLKKTRKIDVYREKHYSYRKLKSSLKAFKIVDYTVKVIKNPKRFYLDDMVPEGSLVSRLPEFLLNRIELIIPNFIFLLLKPVPGASKCSLTRKEMS